MKFSNKRTLQYSDQFKKNHMTSKQDLLKNLIVLSKLLIKNLKMIRDILLLITML